jgi:hypothetical protein
MAYFAEQFFGAKGVKICNTEWYQFSRLGLADLLPCVSDKPDTIYRVVKRLEQKDLIMLLKKHGSEYYTLTEAGLRYGETSKYIQKGYKNTDEHPSDTDEHPNGSENDPKTQPLNSERNPNGSERNPNGSEQNPPHSEQNPKTPYSKGGLGGLGGLEVIPPIIPQGGVSLKKNDDDFIESKKTRSKKTPGAKFEPDLSQYDENTQGLILEWIEHRIALGKAIKTQYAISRFVAELRRLAEGSFNKAKELVEYMRYREWQTVCPIPQNYQRNGKPQQSNEDHARTVVNIAANAIAGAEKSRLDREERERRIRESSPGY